MKSDLVINLVPIELNEENGFTIYVSDTTDDDPRGTHRSIFVEEDERLKDHGDDKVLWDIERFDGATELKIVRPTFSFIGLILLFTWSSKVVGC